VPPRKSLRWFKLEDPRRPARRLSPILGSPLRARSSETLTFSGPAAADPDPSPAGAIYHGHRPVIPYSSEKLRKVRLRTIRPRTPTDSTAVAPRERPERVPRSLGTPMGIVTGGTPLRSSGRLGATIPRTGEQMRAS
jgi:hypothetical protein